MFDDFIRQEDQYLESMALMAPSKGGGVEANRPPSTEFGSVDDEDYVQACEQLLRNSEHTTTNNPGMPNEGDDRSHAEQMDFEMG